MVVSFIIFSDSVAQMLVFDRNFREGIKLHKKGYYIEAYDMFIKTGNYIAESNITDSNNLRILGLAYVCATISAESAGSAAAYKSWGEAIKYFLESGSNWEQEKQNLKYLAESIQKKLRASSIDITNVDKNSNEFVLLDLLESFSLLEYKSPRIGLKAETKDQHRISIRSMRSYIPENQKEKTTIVREREHVMPVPDNIPLESTDQKKEEQKQIQQPTQKTETPPVWGGFEANRGVVGNKSQINKSIPPENANTTQRRHRLSLEDLQHANIAWKYFENNYNPGSGLINSVDGYRVATLWTIGSSLAAYVAAEKMGIIEQKDFDEKIRLVLETLAGIKLYANELPNKVYSTDTVQMLGPYNQPSETGVGWVAVDIGRVLIWLKIIDNWYRDKSWLVNKIIQSWDFDRLVVDGEMFGAFFNGQREFYKQEGRFGNEQYAAMGLKLWKFNMEAALNYKLHLAHTTSYSMEIPYDNRKDAILTSDPFILAAIELNGINNDYWDIIETIYNVQGARWKSTGIITCVGEDYLATEPWFVYNCIRAKNTNWVCISSQGETTDNLKNISTKITFAWHYLFEEKYTEIAFKKVNNLFNPERGWYAGLFENGEINNSLNCNTNAIILEAILSKMYPQGFLKDY